MFVFVRKPSDTAFKLLLLTETIIGLKTTVYVDMLTLY